MEEIDIDSLLDKADEAKDRADEINRLKVVVHCGFVRGDNGKYHVEVSWHHGREQFYWEVYDYGRCDKGQRRVMDGFGKDFHQAFDKLIRVMSESTGTEVYYNEKTESELANLFGWQTPIDWEKELA